MSKRFHLVSGEAATIVARLIEQDCRLMLFGAAGIGKSTLARLLADGLAAKGQPCQCIGADPGSPAFGIPGAITLAERDNNQWKVNALEPLCTLDAVRFRLPLIEAVRRLAQKASSGVLLLDGPGVVRGVAGSELLQALAETAAVDIVLAITPVRGAPPLAEELAALPAECWLVPATADARRPGKGTRARVRSVQWDTYLSVATEQEIDLGRLSIIGTPPPLDERDAWVGRQIALLRGRRCLAMGEVIQARLGHLRVRAPEISVAADTLLVRDATRGSDGFLVSAVPFANAPLGFAPVAGLVPGTSPSYGSRPLGRIGGVDVALVNGVFGDPLLHLRLRHLPRSLLFDLGDGSHLSARIAHQVSDVFISHAHMDHLGGFLWLLRSRIGEFPACRLYGPPGLAEHIGALVRGFLWDRVGKYGPAFEISELYGDTVQRFRLQAGKLEVKILPATPVSDGTVRREPGYRIRAITLDHHTPVLAYAFEPESELNVRKDRLRKLEMAPGPWLGQLKERVRSGDMNARLTLPDGRQAGVAELANELLMVTAGKRLVYATDLADTPQNRERLIDLARNAHTLFLEAVFTEADNARALRHGHLTARACGEIATAAGVCRLVPFHFSPRYADNPRALFDEIEAACRCAVLPSLPLDPSGLPSKCMR